MTKSVKHQSLPGGDGTRKKCRGWPKKMKIITHTIKLWRMLTGALGALLVKQHPKIIIK